jgi:hypothetical protein
LTPSYGQNEIRYYLGEDINNTVKLVARDWKNKVDYNKDGLINCIDAAVSFYKWYPDKSKVRIILNLNKKTGMNHLFNLVFFNGSWIAIEPQAWSSRYMSYLVCDVWGRKYNATYNRDVTSDYVRYIGGR